MGAAIDVQRLVLQVDASIELAKRNLKDLTNVIDNETGKWDNSLKNGERSLKRTGQALASVGQYRSGMQQLGFQLNDVATQMASGTKASIIFAQQSGQVIQALQLMGGEGNKFLRFLAGPWGIALTTAAIVLSAFAGKLFDSKDEIGKLVDKMREQARQAQLNRQADEAWKHTIDGLTESIRKRREEQQKALDVDVLSEQDAVKTAQGELTQQRGNLTSKIKEQRAAQAERDAAQRIYNDLAAAGHADAAEPALRAAQSKVDRLTREVNQLQQSIFLAEQNLKGAQAAVVSRSVENKYDAVKAATDAYAATQGKLQRQLDRNIITLDEYNKKLDAARAKLEAAKNAAKDAKSDSAAGDLTKFVSPVGGGAITGQFGEKRPGHTHAGLDLAVPVGTSVQAAAAGTVIEAGVLPGYGNVVIIDHGRGTITRYAHLSRLDAAKGQRVDQGDVIGLSGGAKGAPGAGNSQGPHLHFEVRRNGRPVDPRKGVFPSDPALAGSGAVRSAESEAERQKRRDDAFTEQRARLNQELIDAQVQLVSGIQAQAEAQKDSVTSEEQRRNLAIQNDVTEKNLTQAQADELKAINHSIALQKIANIERQKQVRLLQEQDRDAEQATAQRTDALQYEDSIARTQADHRRIQLEILDIVYEEKRAHLERLKLMAEGNGDLAEANRIQAQINNLPSEQDRDRDRVMRGTKNPIEAWADSVPQSAAEITQSLQDIEARGLDNLADSMSQVLMGTKSLSAAFKDMAASIIGDILRMTIRMLIFRALSSALGGALGGGGQPVGIGSLASPSTSFASSNLGNFNFGALPHMATGGILPIGGLGGVDANVLSINGKPRAMVSGNEHLAVIPSVPRVGVPVNGGQQGAGDLTLHVNVDARDAVLTSAVKQWVVEGIAEAAPHIVRASRDTTLRSIGRPTLPG